jgi:hypothetical protein
LPGKSAEKMFSRIPNIGNSPIALVPILPNKTEKLII